MPHSLDAHSVRLWCSRALDLLAAHRAELDRINVYPVPDGDTGTNLVLTLRAAADELSVSATADAGAALRAMARGAVLGARGNSGVIVSQFLRGLAEHLDGVPADGPAVAAAFDRADRLAWAAVDDPVEGSALSVIRAAAAGATAADLGGAGGADLAAVVRAAATAAHDALRRTPEQLDVLARAGVVDAGGWGVLVLLTAMAEATGAGGAGHPGPGPGSGSTPVDLLARAPVVAGPPPGGPRGYEYEVQYLLDSTADRIGPLRDRLAALGDCVALVGTGEGTWNVHVHVDDVGAAIEAGIDVGRPSRITVQRVTGEPGRALRPAPGWPSPPDRSGVAVLAVAPGEGVDGLFEAEGVVVLGTSATRPPTVEEVTDAITGTGTESVIVLPAHGAVTGAADRAARRARVRGLRVAVVPIRSPVQGLAAVAVHDESRRFDDDVIAMAEAAAATRWAEVTVATREALTMAGRCRAGDVLGLAEGDVVLIARTVPQATRELVDRMLRVGGELVTVILGDGADPELGDRIERHVVSRYPGVEVRVYRGGQPHHPVILGVE